MVKNENVDIMKYLPHMQKIDSDMLDDVMSLMDGYDYNAITRDDVKRALAKDNISLQDYGALLSPVAQEFLEEMAQKSQTLTRQNFGNSICLFTPLYIANYCENLCVYCGFNCKNKIHRAQLTVEEIDIEMKKIAESGLKEILILTGEAKSISSVEYIGEALEIAKKYFYSVQIADLF
ncbi:MAG: 2-iminoacetate synthase ThiH, partial [Clostridia bacterium]